MYDDFAEDEVVTVQAKTAPDPVPRLKEEDPHKAKSERLKAAGLGDAGEDGDREKESKKEAPFKVSVLVMEVRLVVVVMMVAVVVVMLGLLMC